MSLETFISKVEMDGYNPSEDEVIASLPVMMKPFNKRAGRWNSSVGTNIIILRYGLQGNPIHTLERLGNMYGVSKERMRQIEVKALRFVRWYIRANSSL